MEITTAPMVGVGEIVALVRLERVRVTCPACLQAVEAVARDGRVRGYCTVAGRRVDFLAQTPPEPDADQPQAKISQAMKKQWQDPEYRAKMSEALEKSRQEPAYGAKISESLKKRWQDPAYRATMSEAVKKRWQDPEYRARMGAIRKKRWQDPEYRARMGAIRKKG